MKRMQHNLLLERSIQFAYYYPFTLVACIISTIEERQISFPAAFHRNCQYNRFNAFQWLTIAFLFLIHHWSQDADLVFGNAFPVFVECDSGGHSILTDSHLGIMMLV